MIRRREIYWKMEWAAFRDRNPY